MKTTLIFTLLMLSIVLGAFAQDALFHGFVQANYSVRATKTDDAPKEMAAHEKDLIFGDERTQLELSRFSAAGNASISAKLDLYRDAISGIAKINVREAYLDLSFWKFDWRIGRQIITWGLGDLTFINDTFPKDWVALLSGQPLQYLKIGSDALNVSFHPGFIEAQAIVVPFFEPDNLPTGERLFFYNPLPPVSKMSLVLPKLQFENFEAAGRLYRTLWKFDLTLYGYRGFFRMPAVKNFEPNASEMTLFYPELGVYGASAQGNLLGGIVNLEGGYYDFVDDRGGDNPFVENPQARFLAGYQRAFGADLTIGAQYYGEAMLKYDEYERTLLSGFPKRDQIRHNITLRIMQFFKYQTLRLSLFAWVSPNDEDYFINPEIRYSFTDELWAALGGNIFGGTEKHTFFGQFDE
ncbi:MAG: hypothetical protein ACE5PV_07540, partial [Candidatus Poribacteria bacterium]